MRAPEQVVQWLRANAIPLSGVVPGSGTADLGPFMEMVGDARLVGLGESTFGTHEFLTLRQRLIELLVAEAGFNTVALETDWPEAELVNDYILHGIGTPQAALEHLHAWDLQTDEVVALVESLRQSELRGRRVAFRGARISEPHLAADRVVEFLSAVDPEAARAAIDAYGVMSEMWPRHEHGGVAAEQAQLGAREAWLAYVAAPKARRRLQSELVREVHQRLLDNFERYAEKAGPDATRKAAEYASAVALTDGYRRQEADAAGAKGPVTRMRKLARSVIQQWYPRPGAEPADADVAEMVASMVSGDSRVVFLAHNGHIAAVRPHVGWHLSERLGGNYVRVGLVALTGSFNARSMGDQDPAVPGPITSFRLPSPHPGSLEAALAEIGVDACIVDLRLPAAGAVKDWLETPSPTFMAGHFVDETRLEHSVGVAAPRRAFDIVICLRETTPSRLMARSSPP